MFKQVLTFALVAGGFAVVAQAADTPTDKAKDPNRKICEKIEVTGSRLGATKVCMTEQQWQDQRRAQRDDLESAQRNSGIRQSN